MVGPLSRSYRWWLTTYGEGAVNNTKIATVTPGRDAVEAFSGRLDGERLCFYQEADTTATATTPLSTGGRAKNTWWSAGTTAPETRSRSQSPSRGS